MTILDYSQALEDVAPMEIVSDDIPPLNMLIQGGFFEEQKDYCRYCHKAMELSVNELEDGGGCDRVNRIHQCMLCGWWKQEELEEIYIGEGQDRISKQRTRFGVLRRYSPSSIEAPIAALRRTLFKNPGLIHSIHPTKCEELVGSVFRDHMNCYVRHVGQTGDGGIDLFLITGNESFVVQVKRRSNPHTVEGVAPIRDLIGAMILTGQRNGIFVTTAKAFSKAARSAAANAPVKADDIQSIDLVDWPKFVGLMELTLDKVERPWANLPWNDDDDW